MFLFDVETSLKFRGCRRREKYAMGEKSMKRSRGILRSAAAYGRDTARVLRWVCRRVLRSRLELLGGQKKAKVTEL